MKILIVHNYYGSIAPSGESQVFEAETGMLRAHGHEVAEFTRHSDEIRQQGARGTLKGALATAWNPWMAKAVHEKVVSFKPEVVHVHNTFPLISPAIFHAIGSKAARVLTLHNYRLFCPAAIPMRAGKVCTECLDRHSVLPSLRHGCYRGSRLATLPLAANVVLHRRLGTWSNRVDAFVALSEFQRERMVAAGLPKERMHVKPNFFPGNPAVVPWQERHDCVVFAGRLGEEKGVRSLVKAWLSWGAAAPELRIIGDGDLRSELESMVRQAPLVPIRFLGQLPGAHTQREIAQARLLVLPSEWFEGFPMVVREAFAYGTPAAVSSMGPLPTIVQHGESGVVFQPADPQSLLGVVRQAWQDQALLQQLSVGARRSFETLYNEQANYERLMEIYARAIEVSNSRARN